VNRRTEPEKGRTVNSCYRVRSLRKGEKKSKNRLGMKITNPADEKVVRQERRRIREKKEKDQLGHRYRGGGAKRASAATDRQEVRNRRTVIPTGRAPPFFLTDLWFAGPPVSLGEGKASFGERREKERCQWKV